MTRAVVLLRGVNVGGHHRVPMAALRTLCDTLQLDVPDVVVAADTFTSILAEHRLAVPNVDPSRRLAAFAPESHALLTEDAS